jgi:hypothetical protein
VDITKKGEDHMKVVKLISAALLVALALVTVAACGAPPAAMSDIPVPPDSKPLEKGQNMFADAGIDAMQQALEAQQLKSEVKLYAVPAGMTWEQVKSFYTGKLDTNWATSPELSNESSAFSAVGWTRGRNQALVIGYGPDPLDSGGDGFVMVMLASR